MKTADLELMEAGKPTRSLGALFGRGDARKGPGIRADGLPSEPTKASQTVPDVLALLRADHVTKVGVHGDKGFLDSFKAQAGDIDCLWLSNDYVVDQPLGALPFAHHHWDGCQAIVVGGADAATRFRLALRGALAHAPQLPVHWVEENWESCAATLAIPAEIDDVDLLVFNHFAEFFGIKDPLQLRCDVVSEQGAKRSYRVLGPSQSATINLKELAGGRSGPTRLKILVAHPGPVRANAGNLCVSADVFWKDSSAIVQSSHEASRAAPKQQVLRVAESVARGGRVLMTVPNDDPGMGTDDAIVIGAGPERKEQKRSRSRPVEEVPFERSEATGTPRGFFTASYQGAGASFWYALEEGCFSKPGKQGSIAGHRVRPVGGDDRATAALRPDELRVTEQAVAAGFMIHPSFVPVMHGRARLTFGFNFDATNPPIEHYWLRFHGADGAFLGELRWRKNFAGPAFIEDVLNAWGSPERFRVAGAMVSPDHLKCDLAPQRLVTAADLVVRHLETGDQDATELPSSWRNLGATVPTLSHAVHPSGGVMGHTNLIGRVRCRDGYRTGIVVANGSGNLKYDTTAEAEIAVINHTGRRLSHLVRLPAFASQVVWLDDVMARLKEHVGETGIAAVQVVSADADLTAHVIGLSPDGAVGLQHLWGC
jgi:hypothetical protein